MLIAWTVAKERQAVLNELDKQTEDSHKLGDRVVSRQVQEAMQLFLNRGAVLVLDACSEIRR